MKTFCERSHEPRLRRRFSKGPVRRVDAASNSVCERADMETSTVADLRYVDVVIADVGLA